MEIGKTDNEMFLFIAAETTIDAFSKSYIAQVELNNMQLILDPYFKKIKGEACEITLQFPVSVYVCPRNNV
jgi:hypothetical protein